MRRQDKELARRNGYRQKLWSKLMESMLLQCREIQCIEDKRRQKEAGLHEWHVVTMNEFP